MYNLHAFVDLQIPISKNVASLLLVSQHFLSCSTVHWQIGNIGKKERVKSQKVVHRVFHRFRGHCQFMARGKNKKG